MIKRAIITLLAIVISLLVLLFISLFTNKEKQKQIERLEYNQEGLFLDIRHYKSKDSLSIAEVKKLTLTNDELEKYNHNLRKEIKEMGFKIRDLQNIVSTSQSAEYIFIAHKRDTIIVNNNTKDTLNCFAYSDKWIDFFQVDSNISIKTHDSIVVLQHCKTRKFLWWTIKKYSGKTTIKNYNPYSTTTSIISIDLNK